MPKSRYLALAKNAIPQLPIFSTTWECEQGFSTFLTIKSKTRNPLVNPEHDFQCSVSKISPRFAKLVEEKQAQHDLQYLLVDNFACLCLCTCANKLSLLLYIF